MRRSLILPAGTASSPTDDIALTRAAEAAELDAVWIGERSGSTATARLAALAAATARVVVGLGLVPLSARGADHLDETMTTLSLLAPARVALAFSLPTALAAPLRPAWAARLPEVVTRVRQADIPVSVAVADPATAMSAADHIDRVILRGADTVLTARIAEVLARLPDPPQIDVWLDLAGPADDLDHLQPVVAERLAVAGVTGHATLRSISTRDFPGLQGEVDSAYATGDVTRAAACVPRELVEQTCLTGDADHLAARVRAYAEAGATGITALPHAPTAEARIAAAQAFAEASTPDPQRDA